MNGVDAIESGYIVRRLEARALHRRLDVDVEFQEEVNVLYGRNGAGKTTLLHILAHILNGTTDRFAFLDFRSIQLITDQGDRIQVLRERDHQSGGEEIALLLNSVPVTRFSVEDIRREAESQEGYSHSDTPVTQRVREETKNKLPVNRAAYFPAFRSVIDAWFSMHVDRELRTSSRVRRDASLDDWYHYPPSFLRSRAARLTQLARDLFGEFAPTINYPSPLEIERELASKAREAAVHVITGNQDILSEAFLGSFAALSEKEVLTKETPDAILADIRSALESLDKAEAGSAGETKPQDVYARLGAIAARLETEHLSEAAANVLAVYRKSLYERLESQEAAFEPIERYVNSLNEFLEGKRISVARSPVRSSKRSVAVEFEDGTKTVLRALSSGERQIVSLLYAVSFRETGSVVLIDEPELSLHVDWQRMLLRKMADQLGGKQIIVCTHAPEIGADYENRYQILRPRPTSELGELAELEESDETAEALEELV